MAGNVEQALAKLGITLPTPASPIANYVPAVRTGNQLVVSGQICLGADGKLTRFADFNRVAAWLDSGAAGAKIVYRAGKPRASRRTDNARRRARSSTPDRSQLRRCPGCAAQSAVAPTTSGQTASAPLPADGWPGATALTAD